MSHFCDVMRINYVFGAPHVFASSAFYISLCSELVRLISDEDMFLIANCSCSVGGVVQNDEMKTIKQHDVNKRCDV